MGAAQDIRIRRDGRAGRITLARPAALNALTYDMAMAIEAALAQWRDDDRVALVIIDGEGERAFCAGGDIEALYRAGRAGDFAFGRRFWQDEYRMNAAIAEYAKPYIAFLHGFVMGGGVGIGCHGSHRIVCESSRLAMPECGIGLIPDVGGSYLLAHAPGQLGPYLGLTGQRMDAADAIVAGFADAFVPAVEWEALKAALCATGDVATIDGFRRADRGGTLAARRTEVDRFFSLASAIDCVRALEADGSPWAAETAAAIRRGCPLSVACTFELVRMARKAASVREALALELRFTWRSMSDGEFLEGVRAQIIDKDRKPQWRTPRLEDVSGERVAAMLAPIAELAAAD
ncbi:MAG: enoyl-CoA hydratase [Alphaproteobacteria bacterium]|nr:MAG: enoyl-CoA hydratase [Alphaproteobacteria bacterium]